MTSQSDVNMAEVFGNNPPHIPSPSPSPSSHQTSVTNKQDSSYPGQQPVTGHSQSSGYDFDLIMAGNTIDPMLLTQAPTSHDSDSGFDFNKIIASWPLSPASLSAIVSNQHQPQSSADNNPDLSFLNTLENPPNSDNVDTTFETEFINFEDFDIVAGMEDVDMDVDMSPSKLPNTPRSSPAMLDQTMVKIELPSEPPTPHST